MSREPIARVDSAAARLLTAWRRAVVQLGLTPDERLDALATAVKLILERGNDTWTFPPLTAADLMAMSDDAFVQRLRDSGMELQTRAALARLDAS